MAITYHAARRIQGLSQNGVILDNLTTDKGWTATGTGNGYNASDYVDFKIITADSSSHAGGRVNIDVQNSDYLNGSNLGTNFTVRTVLRFSALGLASGNQCRTYFGFYDKTDWGGTSQDAFVLQVYLDTSVRRFYTMALDGGTFEGGSETKSQFSLTPAIDTDYYVTFTKSSDTLSIRITTSIDYTGGEKVSISKSGLASLRYFGWKSRGDTQGNGGNVQGTIKPDISIADGVTSFPSAFDVKPVNVQVGSRFEETDTRKIYYKDDISWKELDGAEATNYTSESWYEQLSGETP